MSRLVESCSARATTTGRMMLDQSWAFTKTACSTRRTDGCVSLTFRIALEERTRFVGSCHMGFRE